VMVAAAFGIDTTWTGRDLCADGAILRLERDPRDPADTVRDDAVLTTARIGVGYAGADWAGRAWRFTIAGHPSVSGAAGR
jgi:3-methyladenine DNA glycosylase Mpg